MWYAYIQLQMLMQRVYRLRLIYDEEAKRFKYNPKLNPIYIWINSQIMLVWSVSFYRMIGFFATNNDPNFTIQKFILDLFYWSLMVILLSVSWTIEFRSHEAVWYMNQMMSLKTPEELQDKRLTPETIAMYSLGCCAVIVPIGLGILPFIMNDSPVNEILRFALPQSIMKDPLTEAILVALYWVVQGYLAAIPLTQMLSVVILVLYDYNFHLKPTYEQKVAANSNSMHSVAKQRLKEKMNKKPKVPKLKKLGKRGNVNVTAPQPRVDRKKIEHFKITIQTTVRFPAAFRRYLKVVLIQNAFQIYGKVFFPAMMFVGFILNVICTFVVIRLNDTLPIIIVAIMGILDVIVILNTYFIYHFALVITTESEKFIEFWRNKILSKEYQLQFRTARVIVIFIGSFFSIDFNMILTHFMQIVDMTTNLLLM